MKTRKNERSAAPIRMFFADPSIDCYTYIKFRCSQESNDLR